MEVKPTLLRAVGGSQPIEPKDGDCFTVEELEALVGGDLEKHRIADNKGYIISDRNAKSKGKRFNDEATLVYCLWHGFMDSVHGDAVICPTEMFKNYES